MRAFLCVVLWPATHTMHELIVCLVVGVRKISKQPIPHERRARLAQTHPGVGILETVPTRLAACGHHHCFLFSLSFCPVAAFHSRLPAHEMYAPEIPSLSSVGHLVSNFSVLQSLGGLSSMLMAEKAKLEHTVLERLIIIDTKSK